jgi:hypothetical protein
LKGVGDQDAFAEPYLLGPVCQFNTRLYWDRYSKSNRRPGWE